MFEYMLIQKSDVYNCSARQADLLYVQSASNKRTQRTIITVIIIIIIVVVVIVIDITLTNFAFSHL